MMHFHYLSNDDLTVSGNRLRRIRDVDMKHDFAFVVCTPPFPPFFVQVLFSTFSSILILHDYDYTLLVFALLFSRIDL